MSIRSGTLRPLMIAFVAFGIAAVASAQTTEPQHRGTMMQHHEQMMSGQSSQPESEMPSWWEMRQQWYQKMMQRRQEADQRLHSLVEKMNSATGDAKVQAMQAVINELIEQRQQREQWWGQMMGGSPMMGGMGMMGRGMGMRGSGMGMMGRGMGPGPCCPCRQQPGGETGPSKPGGDQ